MMGFAILGALVAGPLAGFAVLVFLEREGEYRYDDHARDILAFWVTLLIVWGFGFWVLR